MNTKTILLLAFLLALAAAAPAAAGQPEVAGGLGFLTLGSSPLDLTELDSSLEANGLPATRSTLSIGSGGYGFIDRVVVGGEVYGMIGRTVSNATYNTRVDAGMGLFKVGYVAYSNENFRIYPMAGIGGGGVQVKLQKRSAPTFDELLADPGQESTLHSYHLLLDLGIGADYLIKLGETKDGTGNLAIGLRAGYTYSAAQSEWRMGEQLVPNGPEVGFTGPYVRLAIGAGGSGPFRMPQPADKE